MHVAVVFHLLPPAPRATVRTRALGAHGGEINSRCLAALMGSLQQAFASGTLSVASLTVVMGQGSSVMPVLAGGFDEEFNAVRRLLSRATYPTRLVPTMVAELEGGVCGIAKGQQADLLYMVESSTLHGPDSVTALVAAYQRWSSRVAGDLILTPLAAREGDGGGDLRADGETGLQWRALQRSSRTLMLTPAVLERFWEVFDFDSRRWRAGRQTVGNDLEAMHRLIPCLAPTPALALALYGDEPVPADIPAAAWWQLSQVAPQEAPRRAGAAVQREAASSL